MRARTLHTLAMIGDIHGIRRQLALIESQGEEYKPFVVEVRQMADAYDMQRINDFVELYLDVDNEHGAA